MKSLKNILAMAIIALFTISCQSPAQVYQAPVQGYVDVAIFTSIPIAPNINLNVEFSIPPQPHRNAIWIDGYWTFDMGTGSYVWVQGYWIVPPHRKAIWIPGYWNYTGRGYVWVNAGWAPRNYVVPYGFFDGRYDYFGRPVYYHKPARNHSQGYAYKYDHRPEYRTNKFSSSPSYNNERKGRVTTPNQNSGRNSNNSDNNRVSTAPNRNNNNNTRTSTPAATTTNTRRPSTSETPVNNSSSRRSTQENVSPSRSSSRESSSQDNMRSSSSSSPNRGTTVTPSSSSSRSSGTNSGARSSSRSSSSSSSSSRR